MSGRIVVELLVSATGAPMLTGLLSLLELWIAHMVDEAGVCAVSDEEEVVVAAEGMRRPVDFEEVLLMLRR